MLSPSDKALAERVVLTPAERAVLCEQMEALRVNLDASVASLKDGTVVDALDAWSTCFQHWEYARDMVSRKVAEAGHKMRMEDD